MSPVGNLTGYQVDADGNVLWFPYSNDERVLLGRVAVAQFQGARWVRPVSVICPGLKQLDSGTPIVNPPAVEKNITSSAVETSQR